MELREWMAYNKLEPVGQYRTDFMLAIICARVQDILTSKPGRAPTDPMKIIPWLATDLEFQENRNRAKIGEAAFMARLLGVDMEEGTN